MAQNITLLGASYSDVPAVQLPKTGGGTAIFYDDAGSETYTENGTYDVTGLASVVVKVEGSGSAQQILCSSGDPSSSIGNDGDVYLKTSAGGSMEAYPADYTTSGMSSTSHAGDCIGKSADEGSSTQNMYSSGSGTTGVVAYSFDLSEIPSNAVIKSVACEVKAHEENSSRSTFTLQLYAGSTAKGSKTTVSGTGNTIYTLTTGSWTRAELDNLILHTEYGYYGGLVAGATLTVEYEVEDPSAEAKLTINGSGWRITGNGIYQKVNGSWNTVSGVELDKTIKH